MTTAARRRLVVAAAAAAALWGCGGGDDGGRAAAAAPGDAPQAGRVQPAVLKRGNPCSVLRPDEVGQILGVAITMREIVDESTCSFPFDPAPQAQPPRGAEASDAGAEAAAKAFAAAAGPPQLTITLHWDDGPTAITATRMASRLFGGDAGFEKLSGIGDEAWLGPLASTIVFSKGKVGVEIDLRTVLDGREKGIRLAKLIASRLP
jgi:hypothetical protein